MHPKETKQKLKNIAIFGAGGLGREVLVLLHQINQLAPKWNILGFYDDAPHTPATINQYPYLGTTKDLNGVKESLYLAVAIGNPAVKKQVISNIKNTRILYPTLLHPSVVNSNFQFNQIGEGSILCQGVILTTNIMLGKQVLLNLACTVGHDAVISDFAALMPNVNIGGNASIGQGVYLGTNATVLPGIEIGENAIIGAGAVVTKNLPANCTAVGIPAKIIKTHDS